MNKTIDYGKTLWHINNILLKFLNQNDDHITYQICTPNKNKNHSRRQWDGSIKAWKLQLNAWYDTVKEAKEKSLGSQEVNLEIY